MVKYTAPSPFRIFRSFRMLKKYPITNTEYPISKDEKAQVLARDKPWLPVSAQTCRSRILSHSRGFPCKHPHSDLSEKAKPPCPPPVRRLVRRSFSVGGSRIHEGGCLRVKYPAQHNFSTLALSNFRTAIFPSPLIFRCV